MLGKARWLFVTVVLFSVVVSCTAADEGSGNMEYDYYRSSCPQAETIVRTKKASICPHDKSSVCRKLEVKKNTTPGKVNPFAAPQNNKRRRQEEGESNGPPLKKLKKLNSTDDLNIPESIITHSNSQRSDRDDHSIAGRLQRDDEDENGCENPSPESQLIQHQKKLSEMEPSLKRIDLSIVLDLLTDSKFADEMKQLKEGLRTIDKVRELLCEREKNNYN